MRIRTLLLTSLAMLAFAANSVLCRLALRDPANSAASFTLVRLLSGALALGPLAWRQGGPWQGLSGPARYGGPVALFGYAFCFSLAYVGIGSGTGALILFSAVQLTMIGGAVLKRQPMGGMAWAGFGLALFGLLYLVLPGLERPDPASAGLMCLAGISWGAYSLLGQGAADPARSTAANFLGAAPLALALTLAFKFKLSGRGLLLAAISGAVTSGMGYWVWYRVLARLSTSTAAIVQLSVPVLAAAAGILALGEPFQARLAVSSALIFGGITLKILSHRFKVSG